MVCLVQIDSKGGSGLLFRYHDQKKNKKKNKNKNKKKTANLIYAILKVISKLVTV